MTDCASPIAETGLGRVRGVALEDGLVFRGIRYARDPLGDLRFAPPAEPEPWSAVRSAEEFGPAVPQTIDLGRREMFGLPDYVTSEVGSLTLNVWTPAVDDARRPVLVWIHGGAFSWGSGSDPVYDGHRLSTRRDVVVVTINYRLGALGFLALPGVPGSGNVGLLDQLAALRWVRRNIAGFGGDSDNVTIFGQSAGAVSIAAHLAAPPSRGLFHRAIMQSGSGEMVLSAEEASTRAAEFARLLGTVPEDLERLRTIPVEDLLTAQERFDAIMEERGELAAFLPVIDGMLLSERPLDAVSAGRGAPVPLLLGSTRDEARLFTELLPGPEPSEEDLLALLSDHRDPTAARSGYAALDERTAPRDLFAAILGDRLFAAPTERLAVAHARAGHPTWRYEFRYRSPIRDGALGACHSLDIPFVFDLLETDAARRFAGSHAPAALAERIGAGWVALARTGIADWPPFDPESRRTLLLDEHSAPVDDPYGARRALWPEQEQQGPPAPDSVSTAARFA
ncbi:carboxylesterase/lipase family protein [Microbacterium sp. NPDC056052]|uniref:carboxylesterase/lipase family protein n=1 Tax=Microbacterium sp. NPDC056052 TaxID=3345695 RepID=UPI0035E2A2E3